MKRILLIALLTSIISSNAQTVGLIKNESGSLQDGYVLFAPTYGTVTYLIDKCGKQVHSWPSTYTPGLSVYLLSDGTLLRAGNTNNTTFTAGGKGGIIEKFDWEGNVTWSYTISDELQCQHHDIRELPNGNILAIVWELKTNEEAIAMGRNPEKLDSTIWSEKIIEIKPEGTNEGTIVWEWYLWDHIVQNFDETKPNYGVIESNPQLMNINYFATTGPDWIHLNSVDYNPDLDQIVLSSHETGEFWIIDHSTTTEEAASHSGGNSGKGGDFLYRWGNTTAYNVGTTQHFFGQHNAHWIEKGLLFENQIMVYNNGNGRPEGNYSTIEIINPPVEGYNYTSTLPYLPETPSWIYNANNPNNLYSPFISGAQRLSNGNLLYCDGVDGIFNEIDTSGNLVWQYINPVSNNGIAKQGDPKNLNYSFRATFLPKDNSAFEGKVLVPGNTIEDTNEMSNSCSSALATVSNELLSEISIYPNPANNLLNLELGSLKGLNVKIELINTLGQVILERNTSLNQISIPVSNYSNGMYFVKISDGSSQKTFKVIVKK